MFTVVRFIFSNLVEEQCDLLFLETVRGSFNLESNSGFLSFSVIENILKKINIENIYNKFEVTDILQKIVYFLNDSDFGNLSINFGDYKLIIIKELKDKRFFMYTEKDNILYLTGYKNYCFKCPRCGIDNGNMISLNNSNFTFNSARGVGICSCGFSDVIEEFIYKCGIEELYIKLKLNSYD